MINSGSGRSGGILVVSLRLLFPATMSSAMSLELKSQLHGRHYYYLKAGMLN